MNFDFAPVGVTREQLIAAARRYRGLQYSPVTRVAETPTGPRGYTDCVGLFFLAARDCGLLPADFDPNLPPSATGVSRERACIEFITRNFTRMEVAARRPGDLLLVCFDSVAHGDEKHVVLLTGEDLILHACDDGTGAGRVWEYDLVTHEISQITRCYSLNNYLLSGESFEDLGDNSEVRDG